MKLTVQYAAAALIALLLFASFSTAAFAASYELSATAKKSFDRMSEAAGSLRTRLTGQYAEWLELQERIRKSESDHKTMRQRNAESLKAVRERIKRIDENKIAPLARAVSETKEHYKPLLDRYTQINKQIEAARPLKNKELNAMLRLQAESLKVAVQLARQDIKAKEAALKKAKDAAKAKQNQVNETLKAIREHEEASKTAKSAAAEIKKSLDADWKTFTPLVKEGTAEAVADKLAAMLTKLERMARHKAAMLEAEKSIAAIIDKANKQLSGM
jgi:hypothetical protein